MKSKYPYIIAALVLVGLYVADEERWGRRVHAQSTPMPQAECDKLRDKPDLAAAKACYQKLTQSRDPWAVAEGFFGLGNMQASNDAFQKAIAANKKDPARLTRWGYLYIVIDQMNDASDCFKEALELDPDYAPAMMGLARVLSESFDGEAKEWASKALKADPKMYQAHELIARMHLEDNNEEKATEAAKEALAIAPNEALQAMSILAAIEQLNDRSGKEWLDKILAIRSNYGEAYETMGHFFVINRRYDEGIASYRKALELKPDLWTARAQLGVNLMRFGKDEEAKMQLEKTFNEGPAPSQMIVRNTLKLMDIYDNFESTTTPRTILKLEKREAPLLKPYFQAEFERAIDTYEKKYKFKLDGPVQVEVYPNHADFEVRTMGMPGLGALGVTFGKVVAMDSPSGRKPGDFHWAATLWHELSHVYVLTMTQSRTPRWFTEGLAVFEETATYPEWGDRMTPREIKAIKEKKLLPIAELDRGYIHPSYPEQVIVSYYQGGRVLTYIIEKWGFDAVLGMIEGYKNKKDTPTVLKEVLKVTPEEFDAGFFPWLEKDTKTAVEGYENWMKNLKIVAEAAKEKQWDEVIEEGLKIRDIYPDYVEPANVYEFLAQAYLGKNDKAKAIENLELFAKNGGRAPATLKQLADLQLEAGNKKAAASALEKLNFIYLKDEGAHQKLGNLYMELGNPQGAIREFQGVLGSGTIDLAGAHYNLASAYRAAKQNEKALEEVYLALEAAPGFKPAQKLLLDLSTQ